MLETTQPISIPSSLGPARAVASWPSDVPLAALISAGETALPAQRYSYLAPIGAREDAHQWLLADPPARHELPPALTIPMLNYELGALLEPAAGRAMKSLWGPGEILCCLAAYRFDHEQGAWSVLGDRDLLPPLVDPGGPSRGYSLGVLASDVGRDEYERRVARAIEYIRAGDVFQVNVAHRLLSGFSGCARSLFANLIERSRPAYAAYLDAQAGAVLSLSPELFLAYDPVTRRCLTRPMKGTARAHAGSASLEASLKDRAELRMIVDLMRNDLSRVCEIGSVCVENQRAIETHAGGDVLQGVATIAGTLRTAKSFRDLIRAAFPAGSITGAPKIRAMQIIEELEHAPRGPYCGAIGVIDATGAACFNVAIRTATIKGPRDGSRFNGAELRYPVGAGIVADSVPALEWQETLAKASIWNQPIQ